MINKQVFPLLSGVFLKRKSFQKKQQYSEHWDDDTHSFFAHLKQRAERSPVIVSNGEGLSSHLFCMPL